MTTDLKTRIESGDLHFLDGLVLLGTIASQRWFGGKSRDVLDARVLDAGVVPGGPPMLAIAIVEVRYGLQTHDLYHLPLGFRPSDDGWDQQVSRKQRAGLPTTRSPTPSSSAGWSSWSAPPSRSTSARRRSLSVPTARCPTRSRTVRPMGAEQSNSSLVLDEQLALKFYRRIEPGLNPELEVLRFLTYRKFPHVAALEGYVTYEGRPLEATLAILQRFVPSHGDAWELALETLGTDPGWLPAHAHRLGEVTAKLHNTLASDPTDPHFAPEEPSTESLALISATIDEEIEHVFAALPDIPALEPVAGRAEEVRDRLRTLTHIGQVGRIIRHHGDYHLGQALWTNDEDWLILDFEGEPARALSERRRKRSPLRDVAGMLRSFAYAASASSIQRGIEPPEGWEEECRSNFQAGYFGEVEPALLPYGEQAIKRLLMIFELEKAVYELRYELANRPDWVSIPVAGIVRMLEADQ